MLVTGDSKDVEIVGIISVAVETAGLVWFALADVVVGRAGWAAAGVVLGGVDGAGRLGGGVFRKKLISGKD